MKPKKSAGHDGMTNHILQQIIHTIAKPIAVLINRSLKEGKCPSRMKTAKVIPLFKSGDPEEPGNYRPISLLSVYSKIFEKNVLVLFNQIWT